MRFHHKRTFQPLRMLPALLLALLLCACGSQTPDVPGSNVTLPVIGIDSWLPGADASESTRASEENPGSHTEPNTTEAVVPSEAESTEAPTVPSSEAETTPAATQPAPTVPAPTKPASTGLRVWIGDARFSAIHDTVSYNKSRDYFICSWGAAYYWMVETAIPAFNALAAQNEIDVVYWCLGASDISKALSEQNYQSAEKYAAELNKLIDQYPNITFYVVSYGPVGGNGIKPSDISDTDAYNEALSAFTFYVYSHSYDSLFIDLGSYLESSGYTVKSDGRQYDTETNRLSYQYVLSQSGQ